MQLDDTEERVLLRDAVAALAADHGSEWFLQQARSGGTTDALRRAAGEAGFLGVNLPEELGGGGRGVTELAIVAEELAAGGCPLLLIVVSPAICGEVIARHGTPEQARRWVPPIARGESIMAFALTEPDAGSNTYALRTRAEPDGSGWRLSGAKHYISGVDQADAVLVVARTGTDPHGRARLGLFVVDTDAPGVTAEPIPVEITSPERQFVLTFDGTPLAPDRFVGLRDGALRSLFDGLNPERITGAAQANGLGRYALAKASRYANEREVWDVPIGAHQGVAHPLAEAYVATEQARLMTARAGELHDAGDPRAGEAANMAKFAAGEASLQALDAAIQTHGGHGLSQEYGLAAYWGAARLTRTAPVSREMILNHIAQHSLRLPRSY
ncbi:acyl-CoA dehydrogenase [Egibacter rhizosphaerae]|uniref:Acyl-CoA dehydrogenase n=1 Tax=Egibacter rhizosphaerae TaxID=1670831 RepID=A0A411YKA1_9ACTN|nr:acyl-CoA dehydrogenase family protein [Egibacter rhizosphaerae]QBI21638.1 acyl-CoA dehydrogenase [Egibacter rhizosphaerae]